MRWSAGSLRTSTTPSSTDPSAPTTGERPAASSGTALRMKTLTVVRALSQVGLLLLREVGVEAVEDEHRDEAPASAR